MLRDLDDEYPVALARAENADVIVSVDRDLLDAALGHPPILTPRQLLDMLVRQEE